MYDGRAGYSVSSRYLPGELDWFGIVDGDLFVYLIPFAVVQGKATICTQKYAQFRLALPRAASEVR